MTSEHQLDSLLKQVAEAHRPELPSPDLIWWRAQILRKQEQRKRIERPIVIMRLVATVACITVCLALLAASLNTLQEILGGSTWMLLPLGIAALMVCAISALLVRSPSTRA
jgi:Na+/glutamate symporter